MSPYVLVGVCVGVPMLDFESVCMSPTRMPVRVVSQKSARPAPFEVVELTESQLVNSLKLGCLLS